MARQAWGLRHDGTPCITACCMHKPITAAMLTRTARTQQQRGRHGWRRVEQQIKVGGGGQTEKSTPRFACRCQTGCMCNGSR